MAKIDALDALEPTVDRHAIRGSVADTAEFVLDRWSTAEKPVEREAAQKVVAVLKGYACQTA